MEMATVWQALGAQVTLLIRGGGLLPKMEPFAGELVAEALTEAGATIRTGVSVTAVERPAPDGPVTAVLDDGTRIEADEILFATGRAPRTDDLGLETVGLEPGSWLTVDDSCRVEGTDWLYAVGDVNHRALLTHQGKYQARIAGAAITARARRTPPLDTAPWGPHAATADHRAVPQVVFTDPEAASVGLTLAEAEHAGHRVRAVDYDPASVAGASLYADGYKGRARMIVDLDREILLGVTFVGPGIGELLHSATVAVAGEVPSPACGTPSRRTRRSARCGCGCWRRTAVKRLSHVVAQLSDRARERHLELCGEVSHLLAGRMHGGGLEVPLLGRRPVVDAPCQVDVAARAVFRRDRQVAFQGAPVARSFPAAEILGQ